MLNFIERNWDISSLGDSYYEPENASNTIISNAKRTLRDIRISNINRLVKTESKLDNSFPHGQFLIDRFHTLFRFDRDQDGRGILLYVQKDIPAKILSHDFPSA